MGNNLSSIFATAKYEKENGSYNLGSWRDRVSLEKMCNSTSSVSYDIPKEIMKAYERERRRECI